MFSDYDIFIDIFKLPHDEVERKIARMKVQKLEEMKIQIMAQNPTLLGVGVPGDGDQDIASEPNGGTGEQDITPDEDQGAGGAGGPDQGGPPKPDQGGPPGDQGQGDQGQGPDMGAPAPGGKPKPKGGGGTGTLQLPEPTEEDIKKYDLGLEDYNSEIDDEEVDFSSSF